MTAGGEVTGDVATGCQVQSWAPWVTAEVRMQVSAQLGA